MSTVECDRTFMADGGEISIEEATSGANGYFCLGCGQELKARKGKINNPHFAHLSAGGAAVRPCDYSSETYRHDLAKKLLRQLKKVRVPAVYAACPPNYHGRLPRLAEAQDVEAAIVFDERNVYLDERGDVRFARRHRTEPFDDHHGQRVLLGRPDVIFLDAQQRPILFIEIYATHKVNEEKLSRLYTIGVDAIEIFIPAHFDQEAIKKLFSVTSNTHWLYNGQQADFRFLATDSHLLANGSAPLLSSKSDFLGDGRRLSAAAVELAMLYKELETAWDDLTLRPSRARLELLRQRARRLQQDLSRTETSVTNDLEQKYESELRSAEKRTQTKSESLQTRKKLLAKKKASWPSELAQMRNECASSLRTLRSESNERKTQLKASTAEKWMQFDSNASGDETSLAELAEKQQQLLAQQSDLAQLEQDLKNRKASLPEQQLQIDADLIMQQQTSEKSSSLSKELKSKQQSYAELKAKLLSLGLIKAEDFPDIQVK